MPTVNIIKKSDIDKTFRVARIMGDFDVKADHVQEHFNADINLPEKWQIGAIVGASGTGKTTIAKELFGDRLYVGGDHKHKSVVDDMPENMSVNDIEKYFYAVGFGSVPSWLKPYDVLSNGEKMRVDIADALMRNDFTVFDEFTSVVDRNVAKVTSMAVQKAIRKTDKKFIAVSCHYDILEWLQPDWIFDTNKMEMSFPLAHAQKCDSQSGNVGENNGKYLGAITI